MLSRQELESEMALRRLSVIQTEKDYIQNMLLFAIYSIAGKELVFKGGTCLYKIYRLNRFSEDLDFSLVKRLDFKKLLNKVLYTMAAAGMYGKIKSFKKHQNQANIDLEFRGPLYNGNQKSTCFIGLDISMRERPLLEAEKQTIYSNYRDIPDFGVFAMNLKEILLEKIAAVYNRKKARDVYDIWFLLKQKNVMIDFSLLYKKLKKQKIKFDKNNFIKKIEEKEPFWKADVAPLIAGELPPFTEIKTGIKELLDKYPLKS